MQTSNTSSIGGSGGRGAGGLTASLRMYEPGGPFVEELHTLRKKNRQLDVVLKRTQAELRRVQERSQQHQQQVDAYLSDRSSEAERELRSTREACDARLSAMEAEQARRVETAVSQALDRQLIELTGSAEQRAQLKEQKQKEERVELLRRQMVRRTMHRELYGGWQAWVELWEARTYAHSRLREVCHRFRSPSVSVAFFSWARQAASERVRREAEASSEESAAALRLEVASLTREVEAARAEMIRRLKQAEQLQAAALEKQRVMLVGSAEEQQAALAAEEREARVDLLRRQVARRMLSSDLAHGWSAWSELWHARRYALDRLREVGNRLRKPELAHAFRAWARLQSLMARAEERQKWTGMRADMRALERRISDLTAEASRRAMEMAEDKQRALEALRVELMGSAAEQAAKQAEEAKEARIEHLQGEAMRRILKGDVRRAWSAWQAFWRRATRSQRSGVEAEGAAKLKKAETERSALAAELRSAREELEQHAARAEHAKRLALERQLKELTGDADEQRRAIEQKEKEARVELLKRQMGRRMLSKDLSKGWQAWVDLWNARRFALMTLRHAANLLRAPQLSTGFRAWADAASRRRQHAERSQQESGLAALRAERDGFEAALAAVREECDAKLAAATADRLSLMEQVAKLSGGQSEREALLEAQTQAAREERVELFRRQIVRRILNRELASAWTAWVEQWEAIGLTRRRLQGATNRLRLPMQEGAFTFWRRDWQRAQRELADEAFESREAQLLAELDEVKAECERTVMRLKHEQQTQYDRLVVELTGSASERMAMEAEKQKEERIELLRRQMGRRAMYREVYAGWSAWIELWEARSYALSRLREVGNRLRKPEVSTAFRIWLEGILEERRQKELEALQLEGRSLEAQLRAARFEAGQLRMVRSKHEDEISDLKRKLGESERRVEVQSDKLDAASTLPAELAALQDKCAGLQQAASEARQKLEEAEDDAAKQREANHELLETLLAQQRRSFEEELASLKAKNAALEARPPPALPLPPVATPTPKEPPPPKKPSPSVEKPASKTREKKSILGNIDLDEGPNAPPVKDQIAHHIRKNSVRVMDLFREWDTDGDGEVTRKEFHNAMHLLGLEVPKKDVDALFSEWDTDGGGAINFRELQKILKTAPNLEPKKGKEGLKAAGSKLMAVAALKRLSKENS